jgi:hypothetical protein
MPSIASTCCAASTYKELTPRRIVLGARFLPLVCPDDWQKSFKQEKKHKNHERIHLVDLSQPCCVPFPCWPQNEAEQWLAWLSNLLMSFLVIKQAFYPVKDLDHGSFVYDYLYTVRPSTRDSFLNVFFLYEDNKTRKYSKIWASTMILQCVSKPILSIAITLIGREI